MIFDSLEKLSIYRNIHPHFVDVETFISVTDLNTLPDGKYPVNSFGAYVSVNEYFPKTESECFIECHRLFIDIQIITKGSEQIGFAQLNDCKTTMTYDKEKDLEKLEGTVSYLPMTPGMFAVFFPHDAHMPCIRKQESDCKVKKIVFKVPVQ